MPNTPPVKSSSDEPEDLGGRDRDDGQVLGAESQRREPEDESQGDGCGHPDEKGERERQAVVGGDRGAVRADK
jgi:hypothetical protein